MKLLTLLSMGRYYVAWPQRSVLAHRILLFSTWSLQLHFDIQYYNRFSMFSKFLSCFLGFMGVLMSAYCYIVCHFKCHFTIWSDVVKNESSIWYFTKFQSCMFQNVITTHWPIYLLFVEVEGFILIESYSIIWIQIISATKYHK